MDIMGGHLFMQCFYMVSNLLLQATDRYLDTLCHISKPHRLLESCVMNPISNINDKNYPN